MNTFNKLANLHKVFFKRADRFQSYESGDRGQGRYRLPPKPLPTNNPNYKEPIKPITAPSQPAPGQPHVQNQKPNMPAHDLQKGDLGLKLNSLANRSKDFGNLALYELTGVNTTKPFNEMFNPKMNTFPDFLHRTHLGFKNDLNPNPMFDKNRGLIGKYYNSITGTGTNDFGSFFRAMLTNRPKPKITDEETAANASRRQMEHMNNLQAHPFGRANPNGLITDGYIQKPMNPNLLPPSQLPKALQGVLGDEAPHLARPPFVMPKTPTSDLQ